MSERPHWRLGLCLVLGAAALFSSALAWGLARGDPETVVALTYLDEPVNGIEPGSPVLMRGVKIGRVRDVGIASDQRHVTVEFEVFLDRLRRLGLADPAGIAAGPFVPPDLRAFLSPVGLTGLQVLALDFVDPARYPLPDLGRIDPPENYVPAVASTRRTLERTIPARLSRMPEAFDRAGRLLDRVDEALVELDPGALSVRAREAFASAEGELAGVDLAAVSTRTAGALQRLRARLGEGRQELEALGGEAGDVERAARRLDALTRDLEAAVDALREGDAARELRTAAGALADLAGEARALLAEVRRAAAGLRASAEAVDATIRPLTDEPGSLLLPVPPDPPPR